MGEFLVFHRFFEARCFLPEQSFPSCEIGSFKECVLENTFNTTKCLDHISSVMIEIPELTVVSSVCPPERILLENLILLEILSNTPAFIVS